MWEMLTSGDNAAGSTVLMAAAMVGTQKTSAAALDAIKDFVDGDEAKVGLPSRRDGFVFFGCIVVRVGASQSAQFCGGCLGVSLVSTFDGVCVGFCLAAPGVNISV